MLNRKILKSVFDLSKKNIFSSNVAVFKNKNSLFANKNNFSTKVTVVDLIKAVQNKDKKSIELFGKSHQHLIAEQTSNDNTALHEAAKRGDVEMINILSESFSAKFNVNHKCHCYLQRTPGHYAAEGGHHDAMKRLFELGADPNIQDEKKRTLLDVAIENKDDKMALLIYQHGGISKDKSVDMKSFAGKLFAKQYIANKPVTEKDIDKKFDDFLSDIKNNRPKKV